MITSRIDAETAAESSIGAILKTARRLSSKKKAWHFHILTPACRLNDSGRYVLYFEDLSTNQRLSYQSDTAPLAAGKELVQLLHQLTINTVSSTPAGAFSQAVSLMLEQAQCLNNSGKTWHHHMLFPRCHFNDTGKWLILFEDEEAKAQLRYASDVEPREELHLLENLYYKSKH